ncbi:hypothetical protein O181_003306 [Austropuccinia psidii MF-1]|uniref:Uncharacterized protein n=1 Tax=Austropuccinia psidii MF-1 TaxID=1389203 RepID=A0A9Q3BDK8_9BASI|nr:hypothetical protein [Austropuccinia psidii MF-1]
MDEIRKVVVEVVQSLHFCSWEWLGRLPGKFDWWFLPNSTSSLHLNFSTGHPHPSKTQYQIINSINPPHIDPRRFYESRPELRLALKIIVISFSFIIKHLFSEAHVGSGLNSHIQS